MRADGRWFTEIGGIALCLASVLGCSTSSEPGEQEIWLAEPIPYTSSLPARCDGLVVMSGNQLTAAQPIHFDFARSQVRAEDEPTLDCMAAAEIDQPVTILLQGHTDSIGSASDNQELGERRAQAAAFYLQAHGVDSSQLIESSAGEASPVAPNRNPLGRAANRRVEFYPTDSQ